MTLKQIREMLAAKATEVRSAHAALETETDSGKQKPLEERFDALFTEHADLVKQETRAQRVEALEERGTGGGGQELTGAEMLEKLREEEGNKEERDSPLLNPDAQKGGYSILRALDKRSNGKVIDGVEGEIHQELEKRYREAGKTAQGFLVPHTLRMNMDTGRVEKRDTIATTTDAAGLIPTVQSPTLIDVLRHRVVLRRMGAKVLTNMVGSFSLPKKTAANSFEWVSEGSKATGSEVTVGNVAFSEKTLTGWTELTRSLMKQSSFDAELIARQDLVEGLAVGLDYAGLANPSGGDGPVGLLYIAGVPTVAMGTNGLAPTWAKIVEMETNVWANDADAESMGYVFNAVTRGKLKTTEKASGTAQFIWQDGQVNGYNAATSNQLPADLDKGSSSGICSAGVFGNFGDLVFALWGGLDVLADPYTKAKEGNVVLTIHQSADVNVRRVESFARVLDVLTG